MKKNLFTNTKAVFAECLKVMEAKNNDYAGEERRGGLRNFELSAEVSGTTVQQGILTRLMDKMTRVGNLLNQKAAVKDESIEDTLKDAINYCAILLYSVKNVR